ncbi:MAG: Trm112 family protein [Alphaproteobacteria bacterium]
MQEKKSSIPPKSQGIASDSTGLNPRLLELLICPLTKGPLTYVPSHQELISQRAGLAYPVREGIPILLVDEARPLEDSEKK